MSIHEKRFGFTIDEIAASATDAQSWKDSHPKPTNPNMGIDGGSFYSTVSDGVKLLLEDKKHSVGFTENEIEAAWNDVTANWEDSNQRQE
ncbi:MAG: hypothetical protein LBL08_00325 [Candidatus Nomurabacteria bacterium]|jgi:hypothetical protein|nr:hypothetical protein [Candidatus Nomurabacteria bacterium]